MIATTIVSALMIGLALTASPTPTPSDSSSESVTVNIPLVAGVNDGGSSGGNGGGTSSGGSHSGGNGSGGTAGSGGGTGSTVCTVITPPAAPVPPSSLVANAGPLTVNPKTVVQGAEVELRSEGFQAGEKVQVVSYPGARVLGNLRVSATGVLDSKVVVPRNLPVGVSAIQVSGWLDCRVASGSLLVVSPSASSVSFMPWGAWIVALSGLGLAGICILIALQLGWLPRLSRRFA